MREASLVQRLTTAGSRDTMQGREARTLKGGVRSCAIKHVVSLAAGQQTATCCDSDSEDCVGYNSSNYDRLSSKQRSSHDTMTMKSSDLMRDLALFNKISLTLNVSFEEIQNMLPVVICNFD